MTKPLPIDLVDISHYQAGPLRLGDTAASGVRGVYHKCTDGTDFVDDTYLTRAAQVGRAGIAFGAYHFGRPGSSRNSHDVVTQAHVEAKHFLDHARLVPGRMIPALDLEKNYGLSRANLTLWVGTFVQDVLKATGVLPIIYTKFDLDNNFGCMLWTARYSDSNEAPYVAKPWKQWDGWQFSNGVDGVPNQVRGIGHCDLDMLRPDLDKRNLIIPRGGHNPPVAPHESGAFRITTQNIKHLPAMPQPDVLHDVNLTCHQSGIVGWQEIEDDRYRDAIRSQDNFSHYFGPSGKADAPISFRRKYFKQVDGGAWHLHEPKKKMTALREVVWVVLEHLPSDRLIYVDNRHYVPGAFNRDHPAPDQRVRRAEWMDGYTRDINWLDGFITGHPGVPTYSLGDYNANLSAGQHVPWQLTVADRSVLYDHSPIPIDHIFTTTPHTLGNDNTRAVIERFELMPGRNSDHQGRRITTHLRWAA